MFVSFFVVGDNMLSIYTIDPKYLTYLSQYDINVKRNHGEHNRPFVGIVFSIHGIGYFAPLGHPRPKHQRMHDGIDFVKIAGGYLGVINLNNMIPVMDGNLKKADIKDYPFLPLKERKYRTLLGDQLLWINRHSDRIISKAEKLHLLYCEGKLRGEVVERCANYPLLEKACMEYQYPLHDMTEVPEELDPKRIYLLVRTATGQLFQHCANETWELSEVGFDDALDTGLRLHRDFIILGAYDDSHFLFMKRDLFEPANPPTYEETVFSSADLDKQMIEEEIHRELKVAKEPLFIIR